MAIDEAMRHRIHERLEELLGSEEATAVMGALIDSDLDHTREMLMLQIEKSAADLGSTLRAEMNQLYRFTFQWTVGSMLAAGSLGLAAGRLLGG